MSVEKKIFEIIHMDFQGGGTSLNPFFFFHSLVFENRMWA